MSDIMALLVLPRIRVQNANAISSPLTWGFPSMTSFIGLMQALERKLPEHIDLEFQRVGVICHGFEPQVTTGGYTRTFHLTRNPVAMDGGTAAIVEEGRVHLDITLVFGVSGEAVVGTVEERNSAAREIGDIVAGMRIAGGSVTPPLAGTSASGVRPVLVPVDENSEARDRQFLGLRRRWLPGFALVSRDDLLQKRLAELHETTPGATAFDAWLDLSRLNIEPPVPEATDKNSSAVEGGRWEVRRPPGWIVPIPVGYGALSELYGPGTVANARDDTTSFRFVESLYSLGQWVSPHRLSGPEDMLWYIHSEPEQGLYRCRNDYQPPYTQQP